MARRKILAIKKKGKIQHEQEKGGLNLKRTRSPEKGRRFRKDRTRIDHFGKQWRHRKKKIFKQRFQEANPGKTDEKGTQYPPRVKREL